MADYGSRDHIEGQTQCTDHLLIAEEGANDIRISNGTRSNSRWSVLLATTVGMVCMASAAVLLISGKTQQLYLSTSSKLVTSSYEFVLTAKNEYGQYDGHWYPWMGDVYGTQLVEPHKETLLTFESNVDFGDYAYTWSIVNDNGLGLSDDYEVVYAADNTLSLLMKTIGIYTLHVALLDSSGVIIHSYATRLVCKYVKRELRTLTVADREKFLDAAAEIWNNRQEEGELKYGKEFTSVDTLVAVHSLASNDIMCDGFHEGTGFISHHLALTNTFEAALRSIDPSVTLPYWDFTIEGEAIKNAGGTPSYMMNVTPVFDEEWFGITDNVTNRIITSRWAGAKMPKNELATKGVQNSYGYIRSYWNNNPDDEVSRRLFDTCGLEPVHKKIPSCSEHYAVLNSAKLANFQLLSPADGHGPLHVQLGGLWGGCVEAYQNFSTKWGSLLDANMTDADILDAGYSKWKWGNTAVRRLMVDTAVMGEYFHIYRSFWRSHMCAIDGKPNYLECPETCGADVPFEECTCQVTALVNGSTTWQNLFPCLLNSESNRNFFTSVMPDEMLEDLVYMLATASVQEGEMIESASTADILFWVTHPVIERMLSAKRLPTVTLMGSSEFYKWPVVSGNNETWLEYSYYSFEKGMNAGFPTIEYRCEGHGHDDVALPGNLTYTTAIRSIIDTNHDGISSNWEFYVAMDPNNMYGNDYVWDHFNWEHCA